MERWTSVCGWLLSIATVLGNGFVVILIAKRRRLHSSSNWLVFSLAVADLGVGIVAFPLSHLCGLFICNMRVYVGFHWFILHSSVTNLCSLTWDRFTAIVHPLKYHTSMTARRTLVVITLAWLIPFLIALYLVSGMYITNSPTALKIIRLTGVSGFNILGCILLLHAVVRILIAKAKHQAALKSERRQLQHNQSLNPSSLPQRRKHTNTASFIIALVLFFLGCYVITSFLMFCLAFSCVNLPIEAGFVTLLLLTGNSTVNPLVYAFLKKDIKREIKIVVFRLELRNNNDERS
ncbi:trace amine-associated receptor 7c-like [Montipora capricornis]|uniref:trace amine-associated receptor 7c-like n=1 Tax=Montipora foliosa TaxID=591990 RepID=UPI0035F17BBE